jgi:hypothetical protein
MFSTLPSSGPKNENAELGTSAPIVVEYEGGVKVARIVSRALVR